MHCQLTAAQCASALLQCSHIIAVSRQLEESEGWEEKKKNKGKFEAVAARLKNKSFLVGITLH